MHKHKTAEHDQLENWICCNSSLDNLFDNNLYDKPSGSGTTLSVANCTEL